MSQSATPPLSTRVSTSAWVVGCALIVLVGAVVRVAASRDQLWLDEIWSLGRALKASSAAALFRDAHDNNHQLNSLWMRWLGERESWWAYRALSLAGGIATLVLAVRLAWSGAVDAVQARVAGLSAALLFSSSFLLVTYGSEARGYATAMCAALAAYLVLRSELESPRFWKKALFALVCVLGSASHLTFVHAYGALLLWSAWRLRRALGRCLVLHAVPLAFLACEYWIFIRHMRIGGGFSRTLSEVLAETTCFALGAPDATWIAVVLGVCVALVLALDAWITARAGSDEWIVSLGASVLVPAATVLVFQPEFVAPRYFLTSIVFCLLALARVAAWLAVRGALARAAAVVLVLAPCFGNALRVASLLEHGRGHYLEALRYMQQGAAGPRVSFSAPEDFDTRHVFGFYARYLEPTPRLEYYRRDQLPPGGPDWILIQSTAVEPRPVASVPVGGITYEFERAFSYFGQSGWHWLLYRRRA